jgi:hypothetical protein
VDTDGRNMKNNNGNLPSVSGAIINGLILKGKTDYIGVGILGHNVSCTNVPLPLPHFGIICIAT